MKAINYAMVIIDEKLAKVKRENDTELQRKAQEQADINRIKEEIREDIMGFTAFTARIVDTDDGFVLWPKGRGDCVRVTIMKSVGDYIENERWMVRWKRDGVAENFYYEKAGGCTSTFSEKFGQYMGRLIAEDIK